MPGWKYWSWKAKVRHWARNSLNARSMLLSFVWSRRSSGRTHHIQRNTRSWRRWSVGLRRTMGGEVKLIGSFVCFGLQAWPVWPIWLICCSTQTHILELIKELGLETYPQYNVGKKVYHTGRPGAKIHTYTSSIPVLSPLVMMDFMQMLWKVRQPSSSRWSLIKTRFKNKDNDVKQIEANDDRCFTPRSRDCAQQSASRIL